MITIDFNLCLGCGACAALAPETFGFNEKSGKVKVLKQTEKITQEIQNAIENCPVSAIKIENKKNN